MISDYTSGSDVYRAHIFTSSGALNVTAPGTFGDTVEYLVSCWWWWRWTWIWCRRWCWWILEHGTGLPVSVHLQVLILLLLVVVVLVGPAVLHAECQRRIFCVRSPNPYNICWGWWWAGMISPSLRNGLPGGSGGGGGKYGSPVMELEALETLHQYHHHKEMMVVTGMKVVTRAGGGWWCNICWCRCSWTSRTWWIGKRWSRNCIKFYPGPVLLPTLAVVEVVVDHSPGKNWLVQVDHLMQVGVMQTASTQTPEQMTQLLQQVEVVAVADLPMVVTYGPGGNGGSGIVVVRYQIASTHCNRKSNWWCY